MKKSLTIILSISILIGSQSSRGKIDAVFNYMQDKYQIYNLQDLNRKLLKTGSNIPPSALNRDPSDLVGHWELQEQYMGLFITVGSDQLAPTMGSIGGYEPADSSILVTGDGFVTELNYMELTGSLFRNSQTNSRNANALQHAQDYVDSAATLQGQNTFDLIMEFQLSFNTDSTITGGLGGDDPENCEINWPEDPYHVAVYSFVSEYVLQEGGSVGCFLDDETGELDQTYAYVASEIEEQWTNQGGDDDDGDEVFLFMNFNIIDFFMIMFGYFDGIENPTLLMFSPDEERLGLMKLDSGEEYESSPESDLEGLTIDDETMMFSFDNIALFDSTGASGPTLTGAISPVMYELIAGVETEIPIPSIIFEDNESNSEVYTTFNDDGTGYDIEIIEEDYYYSYIDTNISYFNWEATNDSLFLTFLEDDGSVATGFDAYVSLSYSIFEDTIIVTNSIDPCMDPYYYYYSDFDSIEECLEITGMNIFAMDVNDIDDFTQKVTSHHSRVDNVNVSEEKNLPVDYKLYEAYPNPFNPNTTISYELSKASFVEIKIYDLMGRMVNSLVNSDVKPGFHSLKWNATNFQGESVPAGVYLYSIEVGSFIQTKKILFLK